MKKFIMSMYLFIVCFITLPAAALAADTGSADLSVHNNNVDVSLELPDTAAGNITSLRMQLRVTSVDGTMAQPVFTFKDTITSYVKDASVSKQKDSSYIIDVIISGKSSTEIFGNSKDGVIGTITVNPTSKSYQVIVEVMSQDRDSNTPGIKYVGGNGLKEKILPLINTAPVMILSKTGEPDATAKPSAPDTGADLPPSNTVMNVNIGSTRLSVSCKAGSKKVYFNWQKNDKADGYILFEYDKKTKQDKIIKVITDANKTSCSDSFKYAAAYLFRMCPYRTTADGKMIYGDYSDLVSIKVPPANVKGFSASKTKSKVKLSWQKMDNAKGYKIYRSRRKKGKYSIIKTIKKNNTVKYTDKRVTGGKTYYYKVKAYVKDDRKKIVDGKLSKAIKVKM